MYICTVFVCRYVGLSNVIQYMSRFSSWPSGKTSKSRYLFSVASPLASVVHPSSKFTSGCRVTKSALIDVKIWSL